MTKPTLISLFSGIGGIDLAFSTAGFDVIAQVEIDPYCQKVLKHHAPTRWPNAVVYSDVREFGSTQVAYADVIAGGFPCQDISAANPNGLGLEGERSGLWSEFRRIIGEIRPRAVLLENVANVTIRGGVSVIADLAALGYVGRWGIVSAADAGATHRRERWWCVAYPDSIRRGDSFNHRQGRRVLLDQDWDAAQGESQGGKRFSGLNADGELSKLADPRSVGLETRPDKREGVQSKTQPKCARIDLSHGCQKGGAKPRLGRKSYGLSSQLDRHQFPALPHRPQYQWEAPRQILQRGENWVGRIKASGNAVVPQVVYPIAVAIREVLS